MSHRFLGLIAVLLGSFSFTPLADAASMKERTYLDYVISFPTADSNDFSSNTSFRGIGFEALWMSTPNLGLGFSVRWIYFYEKIDSQTSTIGNVTVTGRQLRATDAIPMLLHGKWFFGDSKSEEGRNLEPYFGLGVGSIYGRRELEVGILADNHYGWQFALAPEVGIQLSSWGRGTGVRLGLRYDAGFGSDAIPGISYLSLNIGAAF